MKQIIWSSDALLDETAREYYQNFKREELDDDAYKVSDEEWSDEVYNELGDERQNLNKDVNGVIIAFGDLGLWNGRKSALVASYICGFSIKLFLSIGGTKTFFSSFSSPIARI